QPLDRPVVAGSTRVPGAFFRRPARAHARVLPALLSGHAERCAGGSRVGRPGISLPLVRSSAWPGALVVIAALLGGVLFAFAQGRYAVSLGDLARLAWG